MKERKMEGEKIKVKEKLNNLVRSVKPYLFIWLPFLALEPLHYSGGTNLELMVNANNVSILAHNGYRKGKSNRSEQIKQKIKQQIIDNFPKYRETIEELFNDDRFRIYNISHEKRIYDKLPSDFYVESPFFSRRSLKRALMFEKQNGWAIEEAILRFGPRVEKSKEVIISIIGLESNYGNFFGNRRLFNSLVSMYVYTNKKFALKNIKALLEAMENPFIKIDPFCRSSFLAAIGMPQMMPMWLSYMTKKHDLDGDGYFDPFSVDGIAFVAWYLSQSGANSDLIKAVKYYNPSEAFVKAVILFADSLYKLNKLNELEYDIQIDYNKISHRVYDILPKITVDSSFQLYQPDSERYKEAEKTTGSEK